jgi:DNA-binding XRE family transcriptional regulator
MLGRRVKRGEHLGRQRTAEEEKGPPRGLREVRQAFPLSQHELAAWTGLSESTIQALEKRKRRPRPMTMREVARALKVEVEDIAWW